MAKPDTCIRVTGAREHNLKNINVEIPKNKLVVITGPSGSGKSTLALDVLFAEGKRRYIESLSSYARQFLGMAKKPDVDHITGLCPAIAIEQKTVGSNPRSTVGTITEIYDYMRVLFARVGRLHCPTCKKSIGQQSPESMTNMVLTSFANKEIIVAAPVARAQKGEFVQQLLALFGQGYFRFIIDGVNRRFESEEDIRTLKLKKTLAHTIAVLLDTFDAVLGERVRLTEAIERACALAGGLCTIFVDDQSYTYSSLRMCVACAQSFPELEPRLFSFNSPLGACQHCHGLGTTYQWPWSSDDPQAWKEQYPDFFSRHATILSCARCNGTRLNAHALAVLIDGKNIHEYCCLPIKKLLPVLQKVHLTEYERKIASSMLDEIIRRVTFLSDVGLSYLTLNRCARTLSGGEGQRIRLASQIGSALSGVLYILDEPSIGLHQRDNDRLLGTLARLRDLGNSVIVVEHDIDTIKHADYIIDMGPAAGVHGGQITAVGKPSEITKNKASLTGAYLAGRRSIALPKCWRKPRSFMTIHNLNKNNLKKGPIKIPLGVLTGVSGVSGSGKSTLVMQELVPAFERYHAYAREGEPFDRTESYLQGTRLPANIVVIDQSPIGRTPRSNPATYLGIFDEIRYLFAALPESNARGFKPGRFSFNVQDGRCFECKGDGVITMSMHFLPDVSVQCKACNGRRYNAKTLEITYRGKNIADVLDLTVAQAREFFAAHRSIAKRLGLLCDVGLEYLTLGQPATTLSGGEAQRVKLVDELAKRGVDTLYILDEPTTGLHNSDIEKLLAVLNQLVERGNSVLVIEHNLDVLKTVDYLIDLGPDGGDEGGDVVVQGTPAHVAACVQSHTGRYLKNYLYRDHIPQAG